MSDTCLDLPMIDYEECRCYPLPSSLACGCGGHLLYPYHGGRDRFLFHYHGAHWGGYCLMEYLGKRVEELEKPLPEADGWARGEGAG